MFEFSGIKNFESWGKFNGEFIENEYLYIKGYYKDELKPLTISRYGIGIAGRSAEVDINEKIQIILKEPMKNIEIHLSSLFGHFGTKYKAEVSYKAYYKNNIVEQGKIQEDYENLDKDDKTETNFIFINKVIDKVEFYTINTEVNSNFTIYKIKGSNMKNLQENLNELMKCNAKSIREYVNKKVDIIGDLNESDIEEIQQKLKVLKELLKEDESVDKKVLETLSKNSSTLKEFKGSLITVIDEVKVLKQNQKITKESLLLVETSTNIDVHELCTTFNEYINTDTVDSSL